MSKMIDLNDHAEDEIATYPLDRDEETLRADIRAFWQFMMTSTELAEKQMGVQARQKLLESLHVSDRDFYTHAFIYQLFPLILEYNAVDVFQFAQPESGTLDVFELFQYENELRARGMVSGQTETIHVVPRCIRMEPGDHFVARMIKYRGLTFCFNPYYVSHENAYKLAGDVLQLDRGNRKKSVFLRKVAAPKLIQGIVKMTRDERHEIEIEGLVDANETKVLKTLLHQLWDIAADRSSQNVFEGILPNGKLFRIAGPSQGEEFVIFDSPEARRAYVIGGSRDSMGGFTRVSIVKLPTEWVSIQTFDISGQLTTLGPKALKRVTETMQFVTNGFTQEKKAA